MGARHNGSAGMMTVRPGPGEHRKNGIVTAVPATPSRCDPLDCSQRLGLRDRTGHDAPAGSNKPTLGVTRF